MSSALALAAVLALGAAAHDDDDARALANAHALSAEAGKDTLLGGYLRLDAAHRAASAGSLERFYIAQFLVSQLASVGDYAGATTAYPIGSAHEVADAPAPLDNGYALADAVDTVAMLARGRQAVFLNEAHAQPLTRTVTIRLLERLRREGFTHFAAESLDAKDTQLNARGYPLRSSGHYLEEPLYGDLVREALRLGYVVVPYEHEGGPNQTQDERESGQAHNLVERVLVKSPDARLVVHAGYAHVWESGELFGAKTMAQHFRRATGIDPLTVEQTTLFEHGERKAEHPLYERLASAAKDADPKVAVDRRGRPWSLDPARYDISVVFPRAAVEGGRPTWLALGGARAPHEVSGKDCAGRVPCLVEARYDDEPDQAVPADRVLLREADARSMLYLRPGRYRLQVVHADGAPETRRALDSRPQAQGSP